MIKNSLLLILIPLLLSMVSANANARDIVLKRVSNFAELPSHADLYNSYDHILVVMDDDDTLSMMPCDLENPLDYCQYLGGPAWFDWQTRLLNEQPDSEMLVAQDQKGLLDVSSYLLSISPMLFSANDVPTSIRHLADKSARMLVLTARGSDDIETTSKQFESLNIAGEDGTNESLATVVEKNAIFSDQIDLSGYIELCTPPENGTELVYKKGVLYTSGQAKGPILKCVTDKYNIDAKDNEAMKNIENIIFIDDSFDNARSVYSSYRGTKVYNVYAMAYGKLQNHKDQFIQGDNSEVLQKKANERWLKIKRAKEQKLPVPTIIE